MLVKSLACEFDEDGNGQFDSDGDGEGLLQ